MAPDPNQNNTRQLSLPDQLITKADISRLLREVEGLDSYFLQTSIKGAKLNELPQLSQQLNSLVTTNQLNVLISDNRRAIKNFLTQLKQSAPVVHISFAADPRPDFLMKLMSWFRTNTHPLVLFQVGLRPSIAAGCVLRTTNKFFDFSIHKNLAAAKPKLIEAIGGGDT